MRALSLLSVFLFRIHFETLTIRAQSVPIESQLDDLLVDIEDDFEANAVIKFSKADWRMASMTTRNAVEEIESSRKKAATLVLLETEGVRSTLPRELRNYFAIIFQKLVFLIPNYAYSCRDYFGDVRRQHLDGLLFGSRAN